MHHITEEVHKAFLEEQGWTEEEYLAGFQRNKAPRDGSARFLEYEALVARELAKGEVGYSWWTACLYGNGRGFLFLPLRELAGEGMGLSNGAIRGFFLFCFACVCGQSQVTLLLLVWGWFWRVCV